MADSVPAPVGDGKRDSTSSGLEILRNIHLSEEQLNELFIETVGEEVLEKIPIVSGLLSFAHKFQEKVDAARTTIFLERLEQKIQNHDKFLAVMNKFLTSSSGLVLFNRLLRLLNRDHFDPEVIDLMSDILKKFSSSNIEELFEQLNYVLSQMEKLSPQALLLLSRHKQWQGMRLERATNMSGQLIVGDWDKQVANHFAANANLGLGKEKLQRLTHCFRELQSSGLIFLNNETRSVELSQIGNEVFEYLS